VLVTRRASAPRLFHSGVAFTVRGFPSIFGGTPLEREIRVINRGNSSVWMASDTFKVSGPAALEDPADPPTGIFT